MLLDILPVSLLGIAIKSEDFIEAVEEIIRARQDF